MHTSTDTSYYSSARTLVRSSAQYADLEITEEKLPKRRKKQDPMNSNSNTADNL